MHVHDESAQIENFAGARGETAETWGMAPRVESRTDGCRAATNVDLLDKVGSWFESEDVRRAIIVGSPQHAFPIGRHRTADGEIIVIVGAALVSVDPAKEHITDHGDITQRSQFAQVRGQHHDRVFQRTAPGLRRRRLPGCR